MNEEHKYHDAFVRRDEGFLLLAVFREAIRDSVPTITNEEVEAASAAITEKIEDAYRSRHERITAMLESR